MTLATPPLDMAPEHLRTTFDVLTDLLDEFDTTVDAGSVRAGMVHQRNRVARQLADLRGSDGPAIGVPVVFTPAECASVMSVQGQPVVPLITAGAAATGGLASAQVEMPPGHRAFAHVHHHTDVGVLLLHGAAITLWWHPVTGEVHEVHQTPGQHLHIPAGVPHAAINPYGVSVVAAEFRNNPVFTSDTERLYDLDAVVVDLLGHHFGRLRP